MKIEMEVPDYFVVAKLYDDAFTQVCLINDALESHKKDGRQFHLDSAEDCRRYLVMLNDVIHFYGYEKMKFKEFKFKPRLKIKKFYPELLEQFE